MTAKILDSKVKIWFKWNKNKCAVYEEECSVND